MVSSVAFVNTLAFPIALSFAGLAVALMLVVSVVLLVRWLRRPKSSLDDNYQDIFQTEAMEQKKTPITRTESHSKYYEAVNQKKTIIVPTTTSARKFSSAGVGSAAAVEAYRPSRISRDAGSSSDSDSEDSSGNDGKNNNKNNNNDSSNNNNDSNNKESSLQSKDDNTSTTNNNNNSSSASGNNNNNDAVRSPQQRAVPSNFNPYSKKEASANSVESLEG
jgi:hypothetical protein